MPVFLNVYAGRVSFQAGGFVSFLLSQTASEANYYSYYNYTLPLQNRDLGILAGLTYNPKGKFLMGSRLNYSLTDVSPYTNGNNVNGQLWLGFKF